MGEKENESKETRRHFSNKKTINHNMLNIPKKNFSVRWRRRRRF